MATTAFIHSKILFYLISTTLSPCTEAGSEVLLRGSVQHCRSQMTDHPKTTYPDIQGDNQSRNTSGKAGFQKRTKMTRYSKYICTCPRLITNWDCLQMNPQRVIAFYGFFKLMQISGSSHTLSPPPFNVIAHELNHANSLSLLLPVPESTHSCADLNCSHGQVNALHLGQDRLEMPS